RARRRHFPDRRPDRFQPVTPDIHTDTIDAIGANDRGRSVGLRNAAGQIEFDVLVGPHGSGKSIALRDEALDIPGLYLFCLPTIPLIEEQAKAFRSLRPDLTIIEARSGKGGGRGKIQRQIEDNRDALAAAGTKHAIMFMTHESMMAGDLSSFTDWHVRIDEVPNAIQTGKISISTNQSRNFFSSSFDLKTGGGWSQALLKDSAGNWREQAGDSLISQQAEFFKYAARPQGVYVNVSDWKGAKTVEWFALWSPTFLADVRSLKIAAAAYLESLGARACLNWWDTDIAINEINVPEPPVPRSGEPSIRIHYFTEGHEGTTALWGTSEGRQLIKPICDYLVENVAGLGYWSGNKEATNLMEWRVGGLLTLPKVAGSNKYRALKSCAFIYSSKPQDTDKPLMELFGLTEADILAAREDEDIHQFVMRGVIRNEAYEGDYDIYLYSRRQAEALATKLEPIARSVEVIGVEEAGILSKRIEKPEDEPKSAKAKPLVLGAKGTRMINPKSEQRRLQRRKKSGLIVG
uniref:hypothetical protein n=2 Tax=unclassified Brevundimonas TaxID=2622653 RepID=UPI003CEAF9DE